MKAQHNQTHKEYVLTLTILSQFSKFHSVTFNIQYPFQYIDSGFAYLLVSFYCITALNVGFIFFLLYRLSYRYIRSSLSDFYSYYFFFWVSYFFLFCFIVLEIFISLSHISFVYFDESIPSCASCNLVLILEMVVISFTFFSVFSQFLLHTFLLCAHCSSAFMDYWFVMFFHIFYGLSNNIWFRLECCATASSAFRLGLECFHQLKNFDSQLIPFWN